jgi:hypothetical protein
VVSAATLNAASPSPDLEDTWDEINEDSLVYDPTLEEDAEGDPSILLRDLGDCDPGLVLQAIDTICERYLSDLESDLIWLMRHGRRPVEISRILRIPECEVVRLRKNCFRKIKTVYLYDFHHDKTAFITVMVPMLQLNPKQVRIFTMFFNYFGLRQIAETIGTRPSNIHRSLQMMRRKMQLLAAATPPPFDPFYLNAFDDFKYLCLTLRPTTG